MAYGRVQTPKFYIDANLLASTSGMINIDNTTLGFEPMFAFNPWNKHRFQVATSGNFSRIGFGSSTNLVEASKIIPSLDWIAVLGVQSDVITREIKLEIAAFTQAYEGAGMTQKASIGMNTLNTSYGVISSDSTTANLENGYFLATFDNTWVNDAFGVNHVQLGYKFTGDTNYWLNLGCLSAGWSWSPSVSPDLDLTEEYSQEGTKKIRTIGGKELSLINHTGCPQWLNGGLMPFQRSTENVGIAPGDKASYLSLRKRWGMSFSYIDDSKLKPNLKTDNASSTMNAPFTSALENDVTVYNGISDDFISKVWYGTMGGTLPFIFQPNNDVEEFHIVKFINNTVSFQQIAANTFNVSFELEEVW